MHLRTSLLITLAISGIATANPTWKAELSSPAAGSHPPLPPSVLELQLSWKGMLDAGKLRMETAPRDAKKPGFLVIRSSASSTGPAAALYPYQCHFWSEIVPSTLRPRFFQTSENNRKEASVTTNRYFHDRVESRKVSTRLSTKTTTRSNETFRFSPIFDIFSAMLHVRSQKLAPSDQFTLLIHPIDKPYLLRVKVIGREAHLGRKAIRLSVGLTKIDPKTLKQIPYKKMKRDATLWLSDDTDRIPLEFRAPVYIGDVRAVLSSFKKH